MTTLDAALQQFEAAETNLAKLEALWERIDELLPTGPAFGSPPEYEELCWAFRRILSHVPAIDGFRIEDRLHEYDEAGQMHLDAAEIGEIEVKVWVLNALEEQGRQLNEYRLRLQAKRRELVRVRLVKLIGEIDTVLGNANLAAKRGEVEGKTSIEESEWEHLREGVSEIDTLLGSSPRPPSWASLQRNLDSSLAEMIKADWPIVRQSLTSKLYGQNDPVPTTADDLGEVVAAEPTGPVTPELDWSVLTDEDFERLLFCLISGTSAYENPAWLQKTSAPDRGRDLSVVRVDSATLGDVRRYRTIIQCKHWQSKSIQPKDVSAARDQMELWSPPRVDVLVIATTGRFTADAISLVEKHNQTDRALYIEMWPDTHLERLLAARPHLIGQFGLRGST